MKLVTGKTYLVRLQLRALGGTWDAAQKGWVVPDDKAEQAERLVADATAADRKKLNQYVIPEQCIRCGQRPVLNARGFTEPGTRIYRNGECASCYRLQKKNCKNARRGRFYKRFIETPLFQNQGVKQC